MQDIFLSYKKEDADRVRVLVEAFEREGFSVWWDRDIPPGSTWAQVIEKAVKSCRVVVVVWSELSTVSEWVHKEARKGEQRGNLFPVVIDNVELPFEFEHVQGARLIGWDGVSPNDQFEQLKNKIASFLASQPSRGSMAEAKIERELIREASRKQLTRKRALAGTTLVASAVALGVGLFAPVGSVEIALENLQLEGVRFEIAADRSALSGAGQAAAQSFLVLDQVPIASLIAFGLEDLRIPMSAHAAGATYRDDPLVLLELAGEGSSIDLIGVDLGSGSRVELQKTLKGQQLNMRGAKEEFAVSVSGSIVAVVEEEDTLDFAVPGRIVMRPDSSGVTLEFAPAADRVTLFENLAIDDLRLYRVDQVVDLEQTDVSRHSTIRSGTVSADWMGEPDVLVAGEGLLFDSFEGEVSQLELLGDSTITLNAHGRVTKMRRGFSGDGESLMPTRYGALGSTGKLMTGLGTLFFVGGLVFVNIRLWRRTM